MKKGVVFLLLFILITSVGVIFASFEIGDLPHLINKEYSPSSYIQGWINISLENEPADSLFEIDFDGADYDDSITLVDLLKLNDDVADYTCTPQNCMSDYSANDPLETRVFYLDSKTSKIIGLKLEGNIEKINYIGFIFESSVFSSCYNQLEIDFFNNGVIDIQNENISDSPCLASKSDGCFDDTREINEATITPTPYCQKIKLGNFPGFRLSAWVKNVSSGDSNLTMELYDDNEPKASCKLPKEEILSEGGEVYCDVVYFVEEPKDHYVCIYSDSETAVYKTQNYYDPENGCGFAGWPSSNPSITSAYNISAVGKRFNMIKFLNITSDLFSGESLEGLAEQYLADKYGSDMNCPPEGGCIIPIRFFAEENQVMTIKDLLINYDKVDAFGIEVTNFYNLTETPAIVNMDFQQLYLDDANFSVPEEYGEETFVLILDGAEILSEEISIERIPIIKRLIPTSTASAFPTEFKIIVEEFANITKYEWNFGDGKSKTTTTNTVTHTYITENQYQFNITITDSNQKSAFKIFDVTVGSPEEIVNELLGKMLNDLENVVTQIDEFDSFSKDSLNSVLDVDSLNTRLAEIQVANASTNPDYNAILTALLDLVEKIPESVNISESSNLISFYPDEEIINLDILKEIGGGDYGASDEDKYINAILSWHQQHVETKISLKGFSGMYDQIEEPILKTFDLQIKKKTGLDYDPYLIFLEFDDIKFKEEYSETEETGYIFIDLTEGDKTISFSTTEDISFIDLPVFISPEISKLGIVEPGIFEKDGKGWKWALFILIVFLLALIGIVVYIVLQVWYKKKYEGYLFKNKNELYNLITYVQTVRKKGLKKNEIASKLRKTGWSPERIKYVLKKHAGRRTGMLEIPVENVLTKFKKKGNLQNHKKPRRMPLNHKPPLRHNRRNISKLRNVHRRKFFKK